MGCIIFLCQDIVVVRTCLEHILRAIVRTLHEVSVPLRVNPRTIVRGVRLHDQAVTLPGIGEIVAVLFSRQFVARCVEGVDFLDAFFLPSRVVAVHSAVFAFTDTPQHAVLVVIINRKTLGLYVSPLFHFGRGFAVAELIASRERTGQFAIGRIEIGCNERGQVFCRGPIPIAVGQHPLCA